MNADRQPGMSSQHFEDAIDGFPVAELLGPDRNRELASHALQAWVDILTWELDTFPPASTDVLVSIKTKITDTRDALQGLVAALPASLN